MESGMTPMNVTDRVPLIIYHNADLDGICSAAIAYRHLRSRRPLLLGADYGGGGVPLAEAAGREVFLLDFSYRPKEMTELAGVARSLTWIDHHETAIERCRAADLRFDGIQQTGLAACELTWSWFIPQLPGLRPPVAVWLLGRYDVWDLGADPRILPFQAAVKARNLTPTEPYVQGLLEGYPSGEVARLVREGEVMLEAQRAGSLRTARKLCYTATFDGLRAIVANHWPSNSQWFEGVYDEAHHDLMVAWGFDGDTWHVSLYTTHPSVNCAAVAAVHGGGGHRQAAGYEQPGPWVGVPS